MARDGMRGVIDFEEDRAQSEVRELASSRELREVAEGVATSAPK
jgi:hypothetical protein